MPQRGCRLKLIHWRYERPRAAPSRRGIGRTRGLYIGKVSPIHQFASCASHSRCFFWHGSLHPASCSAAGQVHYRPSQTSASARLSAPPCTAPPRRRRPMCRQGCCCTGTQARAKGPPRAGLLPRPTEIALRRGAPDRQQALPTVPSLVWMFDSHGLWSISHIGPSPVLL
jgi:hypothetical protein